MAGLAFEVKGFQGVPKASGAAFSMEMAGHSSESAYMDRAACARLIASLNPHLPPPSEDARYVVAGQQPGLLTGPLYTFLKAASAVALAQRIGPPALPLFWVASEDHDVLEVNRVELNGKRFIHPFDGQIQRGKVPQVADISLEKAKAPLLDFMKEALPETEFRSGILDVVAGSDFSSYATAFVSLLRWIFSEWDLRVVDPLSLRPLTGPVLADLVERWPQILGAFEKGSSRLSDPPLESVGLFEIHDGLRVPLENPEKTGERIRARPENFSAGAGLRPVLQDAVLPVITTIAGPTELEYLQQIREIYKVGAITPSLLQARIFATYVESKVRSAARKSGLGDERIFDAPALLNQKTPDPELDGIRSGADALINEIRLASSGSEVKWLKKSVGALDAQVDKIIRRLGEDQRTEAGINRARLEKVVQALLPNGKPQERVVNVFQFLNLYGPDFVNRTIESLDPLSTERQVVFMETKE